MSHNPSPLSPPFKITSNEDLTISKDGSFHRLKISKVTEETSGTYRFEADGRKTEAVISVEGKHAALLKKWIHALR